MKKKILIAAAVSVLLVIALVVWNRRTGDAPLYREATVTRGDLTVTITATGTVAPENRLEIKPPISGRVEEILVDEGQAVARGALLAWMSSSERAALLDAARARGPQELKRWEEFYRATPILAPIDGMVISRNVEPGQSFTTADAIFVLSDRLTVKAQVDETDIADIQLKQPARITLDAYPKEVFSAHVDQIAYDSTTVSNVTTYVVDVLPENPPDFLRSGMTASVEFRVASKPGALLLPLEAVRTVEGRSVALLKEPKGKEPVEKEVTVGLNDGRRVEILTGLAEGEAVLIPQRKAASRPANGTNPLSPIRRPGGR
jgi:macrolide-specific efflux system membrane fusion protein